jgi:hypothetical protein
MRETDESFQRTQVHKREATALDRALSAMHVARRVRAS